MTDDPGVMGNLPRSRPGRRSEKRAAEVKPKATRAQTAKPKKAAATKATASRKSGTTASKAKSGASASKPRTSASKPRATGARSRGPAATTPSVGIPADAGDRAPRTAVREERVEAPQGSDPITAALRLGMAVGDAGLKAVAKLAQRLPRP